MLDRNIILLKVISCYFCYIFLWNLILKRIAFFTYKQQKTIPYRVMRFSRFTSTKNLKVHPEDKYKNLYIIPLLNILAWQKDHSFTGFIYFCQSYNNNIPCLTCMLFGFSLMRTIIKNQSISFLTEACKIYDLKQVFHLQFKSLHSFRRLNSLSLILL